jgi:hypothetical protein
VGSRDGAGEDEAESGDEAMRSGLDACQTPSPGADQSQRCGTDRIEHTKSVNDDGGSAGGVDGRSTGVDGGPTGTLLGLPLASAMAAAPIIARASAHVSLNCFIRTSCRVARPVANDMPIEVWRQMSRTERLTFLVAVIRSA